MLEFIHRWRNRRLEDFYSAWRENLTASKLFIRFFDQEENGF